MVKKVPLDKAFQLFQEKKYDKAQKEFKKILENQTTPEWCKVRIKQFQNIISQQLAKTKAKEEASLRLVSYYMNREEYDKAEKTLDALTLAKSDVAYLKAEIQAEQENLEDAVTFLKQAIEEDNTNLGYALNSPSFAAHLNKSEFRFLREMTEQA